MGRNALEVLQDIADHIGWQQPTTLENAELLDNKNTRKLIRAYNRVLRAMSGINDWHQLRRQGEIELVAAYTTGVLRMTNGSTTVTGQADSDGNSPAWTSTHVGRAIVINGHPVVYRVASVQGATQLTLNREFVGTTSDGGTTQDDYSYKIVQDRYDLPVDFDRPVDDVWTRHDSNAATAIEIMSPDEVRARRIARLAYSTGDPEVVTLWREDDAGEHRQAIFDRYPDTQRLVTFDYQIVHPEMDGDSQRILFDMKQEEMIMAGVEFLILRGPEDDQRAGLMLGEFLREQQTAVAKQEIGTQRSTLTAWQGRAYQQRWKWQNRKRGRRIDWGSYFDRANFFDL